jgi:hypothetical protein
VGDILQLQHCQLAYASSTKFQIWLLRVLIANSFRVQCNKCSQTRYSISSVIFTRWPVVKGGFSRWHYLWRTKCICFGVFPFFRVSVDKSTAYAIGNLSNWQLSYLNTSPLHHPRPLTTQTVTYGHSFQPALYSNWATGKQQVEVRQQPEFGRTACYLTSK